MEVTYSRQAPMRGTATDHASSDSLEPWPITQLRRFSVAASNKLRSSQSGGYNLLGSLQQPHRLEQEKQHDQAVLLSRRARSARSTTISSARNVQLPLGAIKFNTIFDAGDSMPLHLDQRRHSVAVMPQPTPFKLASVPDKYRRHPAALIDSQSLVVATGFSTRRFSAANQRRGSTTPSVYSIDDEEEDEEEHDVFDYDGLDKLHFRRGHTSGYDSRNHTPYSPSTPLTPMSPSIPITPGFRKSYSSPVAQQQNDHVSVSVTIDESPSLHDGTAHAEVKVQNPFSDPHQQFSTNTASLSDVTSFASQESLQAISATVRDHDVEAGPAVHATATVNEKGAAFDGSLFPDYAPLVQSRVTAGRIGLMMAIGALNMALVIMFLFLAPQHVSLLVMVALKSRDILSVVWQSVLFIWQILSSPFRKKKPVVVHPPRRIVSLVPVYKESTQDVLDTVDSIIKDNPVRPQDFNIIAIMADGFDVEDDVIVQDTICRVDDFPYFSWKIRESAFRLQFGFRMGLPIMIVRKVKNAGKKDSLIFAFDLFNSDNEATGHCNTEARAMVLDHIRRLYNQPELESFDFVFCTDADTKILAGSVNVLADRLMDEGEQTVGACGIVEADFNKPGRSWKDCGLWYFWDHFQGFQYTYGQWVRRRSESSWGRVTCMPGAITMLRTGSILGQANAEYRSHIQDGNLVHRQVQYQGTDRRLCWSIISRSKKVRTVLETRAACFTIPPQSLSHYLSQRRRWGSNAYFNALVTLTMPNQKIITRIWMTLEMTRSTLVFFRMYNFGHFVYNLVTKFTVIGVAPLLAITLLPQIWFMLFVVLPTPRYRPLIHHYLYGAVLNRMCSIVLTPTVYANVLLGFGDFRWGKSHTGANAATQQQQQQQQQPPNSDAAVDAMEKGQSRPCTPPGDLTEVC